MENISNITHITFSGGAVKGLCYLGVIRYLYIEKLTNKIKYISGVSIGAYFAFVLALHMPIEFIEDAFLETIQMVESENIYSLQKSNFLKLFSSLGMFDMNILINIFKKYLKQKYDCEDMTFLECLKKSGKNLYISATNIQTAKNIIFCAEHTPDVSVLSAVLASMTIPLLFPPVLIEDHYYIDGGFSNDFPMQQFENMLPEQFLGLWICLKDFPVNDKKTFNLFEYMQMVSNVCIYNTINKTLYQYENSFNVLKLHDLPFSDGFEFKMKNDTLIICTKSTDLENLILKGFIDMTNYMNQRYKK